MIVTASSPPYDSANDLWDDLKIQQDLDEFLEYNYIDLNSHCSDKNTQYISFNLQKFISNMGENYNNNDFNFYLQVFEQTTNNSGYQFQTTFQIYEEESNQTCSSYCGDNYEGNCNNGLCECDKNYFDIDCTTYAVQIYPSQKVSIDIDKGQWKFAYIDLTDIANNLNIVYDDDSLNKGIKVDDFYYGFQYYFRPSPCGYVELNAVNSKVLKIDTIKSYLSAVDGNSFFNGNNQVYLFGFYNGGSQSSATVEFEIIMDQSSEEVSSNNHLYYYIIFLGVGFFLCLIIIILYCRRKQSLQMLYQQNIQSYSQNIEQQRRMNKQLKKQKFLKKYKALIQFLMPKATYQGYLEKYPNLKEITECVVCLVEFDQQDESRFTLCGHLFHDQCFDQWVIKNLNCPFCRESYGPTELMKVYRSKKSGNMEELEKKQSKYMKNLKKEQEEEDFGILDQIQNSKIEDENNNTHVHGEAGSERIGIEARQLQQMSEIQSSSNLGALNLQTNNIENSDNNLQDRNSQNVNANANVSNNAQSSANSNRQFFAQEESKSQNINLGDNRQDRIQRQQVQIRYSQNHLENQEQQSQQQVQEDENGRKNAKNKRRQHQLSNFNSNSKNINEEMTSSSQNNLMTINTQLSMNKMNENEERFKQNNMNNSNVSPLRNRGSLMQSQNQNRRVNQLNSVFNRANTNNENNNDYDTNINDNNENNNRNNIYQINEFSNNYNINQNALQNDSDSG
ncbi:hypothetical protein PPERSA_03777 [Pseudocohnilembus persalinus]|uniref:RING-type domain-containing protein n=1 Tax=Pseudocohnilembus persalinus TaxID=266149 RepID=A0A0V0R8A2_PSEPJ|nr:hypothetical protein PPERSA_03777 [Pseudocohnilembus persalinus]|eukprot:KRX10719.1 hypothetical protein PPERSA_03777 [Pseudocohnilembus persalinus]